MSDLLIYVGTYTKNSASKGIYVYSLNLTSGALTLKHEVAGGVNPSYLALHPEGRYLYAVNEMMTLDGERTGAVRAFAVDPETGGLTFLNQQPSQGTGPCYVSVEQTGRYVLVANYMGGSVAMLPIQSDGHVGEATDAVQHHGSGVNPRRQEGPHAHSIVVDPTNQYALVADLGLDKVMIYKLDLGQGKLRPNDTPWAEVTPGAGPRHSVFHPNGKYAYLINELDSTITVFAYDSTNGTLETLQTVPTLPEDFEGQSTCADIHLTPDGRYLYGSNRGHDSIVIFAVDETTGRLSYIGHEPTQGKTPRNFMIDPTGAFLLAANQDSDNIVVFRIDAQTGELTPTGETVSVPKPVCLKVGAAQ